MDKFEWFDSQFANLSNDEQIGVFNKFCELNNYYKYEIYPFVTDEFSKIFSGYTYLDIARFACNNSHRINFSDKYFVVTWNGFKTFSNPYHYIKEYLPDVFKCENAWNQYIDIYYFYHYMFVCFLYLKPGYMNDDEFYDIVKKAVSKYDAKDDIEKAINEILSNSLNGK